MSTRACIKIKEKIYKDSTSKKATSCEIILYHHSDGYPSGVGTDLKEYIRDTVSKWGCGWDAELIATDLVRGAIKRKHWKTDEEEPDMGYVPAICEHPDCEYGYEIDCDKQTLKCYHLSYGIHPWREDDIEEIPDREQ